MAEMRGFGPAMAGPKALDLARGGFGAALGLALAGLALHVTGAWNLVAPLGATTVLVFAAPNSPLAQPWSVVVGNTVSALVALGLAEAMPMGPWVGPLAVALAISAMLLTRALHPPGGAVAFLVAMNMPGDWMTALGTIVIGSASLVAAGVIWNRLAGRSYPLRQIGSPGRHGTHDPSPAARIGLDPTALEGILEDYRQSANLGVADLARLVGAAEQATAARKMEGFTCADIMSRDLVTVGPEAPLSQVADFFRSRGFTSLPVVENGRLLGLIFQIDLIRRARDEAFRQHHGLMRTLARLIDDRRARPPKAGEIMETGGARVGPDTPVGALLPLLADGGSEAVPVVVAGDRLVGIVTRTDLVSALALRLGRG